MRSPQPALGALLEGSFVRDWRRELNWGDLKDLKQFLLLPFIRRQAIHTSGRRCLGDVPQTTHEVVCSICGLASVHRVDEDGHSRKRAALVRERSSPSSMSIVRSLTGINL